MWKSDSRAVVVPVALITCALVGHTAGAQNRPDFNGDHYADLGVGVPGEDLGGKQNVGALGLLYGGTAGVTGLHSQLWDQDSNKVGDKPEANDAFGSAISWGDFDGDGFDDLVVGVPGESLSGASATGCVQVLYGSVNYLNGAGSQLWHQNKQGVIGACAANDRFGAALAGGDFNGDGFDDLAIGIPNESVSNLAAAGAMQILYGSPNGLRVAHNKLLHQDTPGVQGKSGAGDQFGAALGTGDFNNDGFADLAVGVPFEDVLGRVNAGAVNVFYGSASGITSTNNKLWHQSLLGGQNVTEPFDQFGGDFASGDFNNDGFADLAAAARFETVGGVRDNGAVSIIYGSASGLDAPDSQFFGFNNSPDAGDLADDSPNFASGLAAGDIDGDGFDELVVGVAEYVDIDNDDRPAGIIWVLPGTGSGLNALGATGWFVHDATSLPRTAGGRFGATVTVADFSNDGYADVAIGMPGASANSISSQGAVIVMLGSPLGLELHSGERHLQSSFGELSESGDQMGAALCK